MAKKNDPSVDERPLSLDEAAALLLQLDPEEKDELGRLHRALERIAASLTSPPLAGALVADAAKLVGKVAQGKSRKAAGDLEEAGRLIGDAMAVLDELGGPGRTATMGGATSGREGDEGEDGDVRDRVGVGDSVGSGADAGSGAASGSGEGEGESEGEGEGEGEGAEEMGRLPEDADLGLIESFVDESREYLEAAEAAMLLLETDPDDAEACNTVFRAFHTIKGTSAFLGFEELSEFAHWAESLLSRVRDREIRFTGGYADLALRSVDVLKEHLASIQGALSGRPLYRPAGHDALLQILMDPEAAGVTGEGAASVTGSTTAGVSGETAMEGEAEGRAEGGAEPDGGHEAGGARAGESRSRGGERAADLWVRVRTDRLDRLIDMIGELVIAHSIIAEDAKLLESANTEIARNIAHSGKIVRELQDLSVSMRMVPLKATFQKMARLVRDVAHKQGKLVEYVTEAEDTEIDRNMVDVINDPLVHMIRNAVDHGIEPPDVREKLGKPRVGTVRLSAYPAGGNVVIELKDDGRGLDREKILAKAISRGLVDSDRGLSDSDIFNLIFEPGFSTADKITDVSGRGVGMDVVRRNIESVRGRIDIASEPGKGTTFSLRLPLTLAITDGMLVRVGRERYIVPTISIQMSFRPSADSLATVAGRGEMVLLRGDLIPVVRLHRVLDIPDAVTDPTQALLVIVGIGERRYALLVDELLGQQQVVAKSLGGGIGQVPGISGGAILGDGRVGLILDPAQIAVLARQSRSTDAGGGARSVA